VPRSSGSRISSLVTKGSVGRRRIEEGARLVELDGSETNERMVPSILQEAYELRDASAVSEEWDYY
jgi:hypothetical protein